MRIAILGATSQIARDLVLSFTAQGVHELVLYARRPQAATQWLDQVNLSERYPVHDYGAFSADEHFDAILNFVGIGNPAAAAALGASIFDVTLQYDQMALNSVRQRPECRYIFLSSGAAYGASFDAPVDAHTKATASINDLQPSDWYGVAKLHAECHHRSLASLPIVDIRVFNYFSHTQDMSARFLITDIVRAIRDKTVLSISAEYIVRDYIGPADFCNLVNAILGSPPTNAAVDCYSKAPVDKPTLLQAMQTRFGFKFEIAKGDTSVNASGVKQNYYSVNRRAEKFGYKPTLGSIEGLMAELEKLQGTSN